MRRLGRGGGLPPALDGGAGLQGYSGVGLRVCPALSAAAVSDGEFVSGVARCIMQKCERRKARLTRHLADLRSWLLFLGYRVHCTREDLIYGTALFQRLDTRAFKFPVAKRLKEYTTAAMATAATVLREGTPIVSNWGMLIGDQMDLRAIQDEFLERIHWMTNVSAADFDRVSREVTELCEVRVPPPAPPRGRAGGAEGAGGAGEAAGGSPAGSPPGSPTCSSTGSPGRGPRALAAQPGNTLSPASRARGGMFRSHSSALFLLNAEAAPRFGTQTDPGLEGSLSDPESSGSWEGWGPG